MSPSGSLRIPLTADGFAACVATVAAVVDLEVRLPEQPFTAPGGHVAIAQYECLLSGQFGPVLEALGAFHEDDDVALVVADPAPAYYVAAYDFHPGFRAATAGLTNDYWRGLSYEPSGDPTGAIAYTANLVALAGSSGAWAIWGQRDWDLVLVRTDAADGPWLRAGVPFVSPVEALENFTASERWSNPLADHEVSRFLANFSGGSLPS